jgi:hypothetical protein
VFLAPYISLVKASSQSPKQQLSDFRGYGFCQEVGEQGKALRDMACTIYTVPHTMIDVPRSYVPFWLHGVAGADLRPDSFFPADFKGYIPECYGKNYANRRYFFNPTSVTRCQIVWNNGNSAVQCTFNRAEIESKHWKKALYLTEGLATSGEGPSLSYCTECSSTVEDLEKDSDLKIDILSARFGLLTYDQMGKTSAYQEIENTWDNKVRWMRGFQYNGEESSLKCVSQYWSAGLRKEVKDGGNVVVIGSKDVPCRGHGEILKGTTKANIVDMNYRSRSSRISQSNLGLGEPVLFGRVSRVGRTTCSKRSTIVISITSLSTMTTRRNYGS